jgi:hypothetical protein
MWYKLRCRRQMLFIKFNTLVSEFMSMENNIYLMLKKRNTIKQTGTINAFLTVSTYSGNYTVQKILTYFLLHRWNVFSLYWFCDNEHENGHGRAWLATVLPPPQKIISMLDVPYTLYPWQSVNWLACLDYMCQLFACCLYTSPGETLVTIQQQSTNIGKLHLAWYVYSTAETKWWKHMPCSGFNAPVI